MQNSSTWAPSRRSPIDWPPNSFRVGPSIVVALGALAIVVLGTGLAVAYALSIGQLSVEGISQRPPRMSADFQLWSQYALYVPLLAYLLLVLPPLSRLPFRALGFRVPTVSDLAVAVVGAVVMWVAVGTANALVERLTHLHDTEAAIVLLQSVRSPMQQFAFVAMAVLVAPLVEELAFRVFIFNAFLRWTPFWIAALGSGVLFGIAHAQSPSQLVTVGLPLAIGGMVLAGVYARTRCYWSSVITHALFNSVSVVAFFVFHVTS